MEECSYCGGNCPNEPVDSPNLCDGFAGDIDGLYEQVEPIDIEGYGTGIDCDGRNFNGPQAR